MLKFFRNIRQSLLSENLPDRQASNFSKYLLYAIGEILLVVIGILLALQINNWNGQRIERKNETQFLNRLHSDILWDMEILSENLARLTSKKERLQQVRKIIENKEIHSKDSLFYLLERSAVMGTDLREDRRKATFEEMVTSGQLQIIQDVTLRNNIAQFYSMWNHWYNRVGNHRSDYRILVFKLGDLQKVLNKELNLSNDELISLYDLLEQKGLSRAFELNLTHENNYATFAIIRMNSLKKMTDKIITELASAK